MSTHQAGIPMLVFAKTPKAGQVKTRLHSNCSPSQAARIAEILLLACLENLVKNWSGPIKLLVWPDAKTNFFSALSERFDIPIHVQCVGDLGTKMNSGMQQFGFPCAVIGSDIPHVSKESLITAYGLLSQGENVIGPATDGGFYLLGLVAEQPRLFQGVDWGQATVFDRTIQNGQRLGVKLKELDLLYDVDRWADVLCLTSQLPSLNQYLREQKLN